MSLIFPPKKASLFIPNQYLSEDEASGSCAAIRPLESAPPGIRPSVHLYDKTTSQPAEITCHISLYCSLYNVKLDGFVSHNLAMLHHCAESRQLQTSTAFLSLPKKETCQVFETEKQQDVNTNILKDVLFSLLHFTMKGNMQFNLNS